RQRRHRHRRAVLTLRKPRTERAPWHARRPGRGADTPGPFEERGSLWTRQRAWAHLRGPIEGGFDVRGIDLYSRGTNGSPIEHRAELAHVPGPRVRHEPRKRRARQLLLTDVVFEASEERPT